MTLTQGANNSNYKRHIVLPISKKKLTEITNPKKIMIGALIKF